MSASRVCSVLKSFSATRLPRRPELKSSESAEDELLDDDAEDAEVERDKAKNGFDADVLARERGSLDRSFEDAPIGESNVKVWETSFGKIDMIWISRIKRGVS